MISTPNHVDSLLEPDRLVVVADRFSRGEFAALLRHRYPDWEVTTCESYLAGIAEIAQRPARAVVAWLDPAVGQLDKAVAGLRRVASDQTKIILCCTPDMEPKARNTLGSGADDYLIFPPDGAELDNALGCPRLERIAATTTPAVSNAMLEELTQIGDTLAVVGARPMPMLEKLARLVRTAMGARGVTVIVEGAVATSGEVVISPVLSAPLTDKNKVIGHLTVAERPERPYSPGDVEKLTGYAAMATHILRVASSLRRAQRLAETDECTGLPNRRYLHAKLDAILARAEAERFPVTMLLFDLDDFKSYNDRFGHDAGDEILRITGSLFQEHCREQDIVARYGGDEFAVVFWDPEGPRGAGSSHPECALNVLDRFTAALRSQRIAKLDTAASARLTVSGGLATFPWDSNSRDSLIKRADEALLKAKRAGKNRVFLIEAARSQDQATS